MKHAKARREEIVSVGYVHTYVQYLGHSVGESVGGDLNRASQIMKSLPILETMPCVSLHDTEIYVP